MRIMVQHLEDAERMADWLTTLDGEPNVVVGEHGDHEVLLARDLCPPDELVYIGVDRGLPTDHALEDYAEWGLVRRYNPPSRAQL